MASLISHAQCLKQVDERLQLSGSEDATRQFIVDYMSNARRKGNWTIDLEKIMIKFINLSIVLENFTEVRQVFNQYRNICQTQNPESLLVICNSYKTEVEKTFIPKINAFPKELLSKIIEIESEQQPDEYLIYATQQSEKEKLESLRSSLRIVWDSFQIIIDVIRSNRKLEECYAKTISNAFQFCETYNRKSELKKLFDLLRSHLNTLINYGNNKDKNTNFVDITNQDTNERYINIRYEAFSYAKQNNMWQDCYRILEDVNALIFQRGTKNLKSRFQSHYYEKLAEVYWKAEYYNYHAFVYYNHYLVFKKKPDIQESEMTQKVDRVILSILSIPPHPIEGQSEEGHQKFAQMMQQGTNKSIPSRDDLIKMIEHLSLTEGASEVVRNVFELMEGEDFDIFNFSEKASSILAQLSQKDYIKSFVNLLEENLIYKVLRNFGQIYKTLKFDNLLKILSFVTPSRCQQTLVYANAHSIVKCKVDHSKNIIVFTEKASEDFIDASQKIVNLAQEVKLLSDTLLPQTDVKRVAQLKIESEQLLEESHNFVNQRLLNVRQARAALNKRNTDIDQNIDKMIEINTMADLAQRTQTHNQEIQNMENLKLKLAEERKLKEKLLMEINQLKGSQVVKINSKKVEYLTSNDIDEYPVQAFEDTQKQIELKKKEEADNKFKKAYSRCDFIERERRRVEVEKLKNHPDYQVNEDQEQQRINEISQNDFSKNKSTQEIVLKSKQFKDEYFKVIIENKEKQYKEEMKVYKTDMTTKFKEEIIKKARTALQEDKQQNEEELKLLLEKEKTDLDKQANDFIKPVEIYRRVDALVPTVPSKDAPPAPVNTNFDFRSKQPVPAPGKPQEKKTEKRPETDAPIIRRNDAQTEQQPKAFSNPSPITTNTTFGRAPVNTSTTNTTTAPTRNFGSSTTAPAFGISTNPARALNLNTTSGTTTTTAPNTFKNSKPPATTNTDTNTWRKK